MSKTDTLEWLNTYVTKTPPEMKSDTMVLYFAFREGEKVDEVIKKDFPKDIYTDKVLKKMLMVVNTGVLRTEGIEDSIYKFILKSWEFCLVGEDMAKQLVKVEEDFIKNKGFTKFYIAKYKTTNDKMNTVVLDNLMDLECCFMGGYLLKSAEETVL